MKARLLDWQISRNGKECVEKTQQQHTNELGQSDLLLSQIDLVIRRVANNQLSAGQGWREVKQIMNSRNNSQDDII